MATSFRKSQICFRTIKLKPYSNHLINQNDSLTVRHKNHSADKNITFGKPYTFPKFGQRRKQKDSYENDQDIEKNKDMLLQSQKVIISKPFSRKIQTKKSTSLSYKSQKTQRIIKTQMAVENFLQIKQILINGFDHDIQKIIKLHKDHENFLNGQEKDNEYNTIKFGKKLGFKRSQHTGLKNFLKEQRRKTSTKNSLNPNGNFSMLSFQDERKAKILQKFTIEKMTIDPWETFDDFRLRQ